TYAQKINIDVEKAPLEDVLFSLQQQSGYDFIYSTSLIKKAAPITLKLKNADLDQALDECLKNEPFTYTKVNKTIVIKQSEKLLNIPEQNNITIKGLITAESGAPLPGVTVTL